MEHSDGGQDDGSLPEEDAALPTSSNPVTASCSLQPAPALPQQLPDYESIDTSSCSGFLLNLGCDSNEEEEELRSIKDIAEDDLFPTSLQCKFSSKFTLTPVLARKGNEESGNNQHCSLGTPHQGLSMSVDCPERPSKLHRTSTSQYESSTSCRHLFSAFAPTTPAPIEEDDDCNDDCSDQIPPTSTSSKQFTLAHPQGGAAAPSSSPNKQSHVLKEDMDDLPTPIHSPSSSSSCSDCVECSSSGSSSGSSSPIISPYPISPPILSQIKLANKTIVSSPEGDIKRDPDVEMLDPPPACDSQGMPQKLEERNSEDSMPQYIHQNSPHDAKGENKNMKTLPASTLEEVDKEEKGGSAARRVNGEPLEASFVPSSGGSVHSNWTAISGISPLPSSDPTHLSCYRLCHHHRGHPRRHHHHHHHHHHGHRHHHHHRKHQDEAQGGNNMLTSTPIHQKHMVEMVDVSAVISSQEPFSDPRFVISSELIFPDSESDGKAEAVEENNNSSVPTATSGSDKENVHQCPALNVMPVPLQTAMSPKSMEEESTRPKRLKQSMSEGNPVQLEDKKEQESENGMEKQLINVVNILNGEETVKRGLASIPVSRRISRQRSQASGSRIQSRPLSRTEAAALFSAHANFAEEFYFEHLSSPRHSSTVDESLFRAVPLDFCLSATLD